MLCCIPYSIEKMKIELEGSMEAQDMSNYNDADRILTYKALLNAYHPRHCLEFKVSVQRSSFNVIFQSCYSSIK